MRLVLELSFTHMNDGVNRMRNPNDLVQSDINLHSMKGPIVKDLNGQSLALGVTYILVVQGIDHNFHS